jgi:hypothetical protein
MRWATMGLLLFFATACQPQYDGLRVRLLTGQGKVRNDVIELFEGEAIAIEVEPSSSNPFEDYEVFNIVRLRPVDGNLLFISTADDLDRFVLVGRGVGTTEIDVVIDDRRVDVLSAEVYAQEVMP